MPRNTLIPEKKDVKAQKFVSIAIYVFLLFFALHFSIVLHPAPPEQAGSISVGPTQHAPTMMEAIPAALEHMTATPLNIIPTTPKVIFYLLGVSIAYGLFVMYRKAKKQVNKNDLPGGSDGSASWHEDMPGYNKKYTLPYTKEMIAAEVPDPNVIMSKNVKLALDNKFTNRNLNTLVVGGSGTGKSFNVIKPNIALMNTSAIITDPSGELLACTGRALREHGIQVKLFSTSDMVHSNCYNPFDYVYDETGELDETKVSTLIYLFLKNANGAKEKSSGDPFWEKSAKALLTAIAYYLLEGAEQRLLTKKEVNFCTVLSLVQSGKVDEDSSSSRSALEILMENRKAEFAALGIRSRANENFDTFKLATGKTANSILITCAVDLQIFSIEKVKNLTRTDMEEESNNLQLDKIGDRQTMLFINIPQANATYNFLVSMLYSQLFDALYTKAEKICPGKYMVNNKFGQPILTMIPSQEEADQALEQLKKAEIKEVKNQRGVVSYRVSYGAKTLIEMPSRSSAERVLRQAKDATVFRLPPTKQRLPWHVRCLMDEFANIGEIPEFSEKLATMRKYEISCVIVLQSLAQLKAKYDKLYEGIIGNCDTMIFLGSTESETCKYISDKLGKATITSRSRGRSFGKGGGGSSLNYQNKGRSLLEMNEVTLIENKYCIVMLRGEKPFFDNKCSFLDSAIFKETGDYKSELGLGEEEIDLLFKSTPYTDPVIEEKKTTIKKRRMSRATCSPIAFGSSYYISPNPDQEVESFAEGLDIHPVSPRNTRNITNAASSSNINNNQDEKGQIRISDN